MAKDRTQESTDLRHVPGIDPEALLALAKEDTSFDGMEPYRVLPRLKLIQDMTDRSVKERFGEGTLIIRPGDVVVAGYKGKNGPEFFEFVPLAFFAEFLKIADLNDKESGTVVERTFDRNSLLAERARDPGRRVELYPGHETRDHDKQWKYRYVESLRFPGLIYGNHELRGTPIVLSFERGEFNQGVNFCSAVKMRKQTIETEDGDIRVTIPLYLQVWKFNVGYREFDKKRWFGLDFAPGEVPTVDASDFEEMKSQHEELRALHAANRIQVDGDDRETLDDAPTDGVF